MSDSDVGKKDKYIYLGVILAVVTFVGLIIYADRRIPNLLGEWRGLNQTISDVKGLKEWEKTVYITEQEDRRFRGHFEYSEGRKDFFGVIHPGNRRFTWVASDSRGYNFGRIHWRNKISTCYVEPWEEATAGCVVLRRD